jgi:hypothetical protein
MAASEAAILDRDTEHVLSAELRNRALRIALAEAPLPLEPGNIRWGPVEKYQRIIGLEPPHDYCVGFLYWCYEQAKEQLNKEKQKLVFKNPLPRQGQVSGLYDDARQPPKHIVTDAPQPGDIYLRSPGRDNGHPAFIWKVRDARNSIFDTVEGNTAVCWPAGTNCHGNYTHGVFTRTEQNLSGCFFVRY